MKRNPVYSSPRQWVFPIIVNGMVINNFDKIKTDDNGNPYFTWNAVATDYGYRAETKQEKFNRIFQVEDAKLVK